MKQQSSSLSLAIRSGIAGISNAFRAKLASYLAAVPNRTAPQATRINSNPNATWSQFQRTQMMWDGESIVKNSDFGANYVQKRRMYCTSEATYAPDTGDAKRDEDLRAYLDTAWEKMGINCSMLEAFSRTADVELPMRGDSALIWVRDENRMRLMEVQADRIGEIYSYYAYPEVIEGMNYFGGIFTYPTNSPQFAGEYAAFKVFERMDQWYGNPQTYPASDVMFFKDDLMAGHRGVTKFAQCLPIVGNRDMILNATMQTMLQQSKVAAIASNNAGQPDEPSYDPVNYNNGTVEYVERNGDGPVTRWQFNGDSYQVLKSEHPSTSFQLAIDRLDEKSALAIGFPYSFLYSSRDTGGAPSRFEFGIAGKEITRLRQNVYRPRLNIISYVTIMDAIERKIFRPSILKNKSSGRFENTLTRGNWNFGTLPTADAFRDDKSDVASVRAGTMTRNDVTTANSGRPYSVVLRQSAQEAIEQAKIVQDSNKQLEAEGYDGNLTKDDIAQISDNPQQAANAQAIDLNGKTNGPPQKTAALSSFNEAQHPRVGSGEHGGEFASNPEKESSDQVKERMKAAQAKDPASQETKDLQKLFDKTRLRESEEKKWAARKAEDDVKNAKKLANQERASGKTKKQKGEAIPIAGNTYPVKDKLKELGAKWDSDKKAWTAKDKDMHDKANALISEHHKSISVKPASSAPHVPKPWEEPALEGGMARISRKSRSRDPVFEKGQTVFVKEEGGEVPHRVEKTGVRFRNDAMDEDAHTHWAHTKPITGDEALKIGKERADFKSKENIQSRISTHESLAADDFRHTESEGYKAAKVASEKLKNHKGSMVDLENELRNSHPELF